MKNYKTIIAAVVAGVALTAVTSQAAISFNFTGGTGNGATFSNTGTFTFVNPFQINNEFGGSSLNNLFVTLIGSPFTIGTVIGAPGSESATVTSTGTAQIVISDGSLNFTGDVANGVITQSGSAQVINNLFTINVGNLKYTGANTDLIALRNFGLGKLQFTFASDANGDDLIGLKAGGAGAQVLGVAGSYSSAVPEPSTVVAGALMLLPFGIGAIRSIRKDNKA